MALSAFPAAAQTPRFLPKVQQYISVDDAVIGTRMKEAREITAEEIGVSAASVREAAARIRRHVHRTPAARSATLSDRLKTNVYLKYELFQLTGSFKVRGVFNKLLALNNQKDFKGLVAVSGGNHAQAVAYVARKFGTTATILMPQNTPRNYVEATRGYGAEIVFKTSAAEAFKDIPEYEKAGRLMVHPFDDPVVIAGQGTVGLEILEDIPQATDVIVSIGGGGLMAGVTTCLKDANLNIRIWGVETKGADCMAQALSAGHPVTLPAITSLAKTLGAPSASERTLAVAKKYLESVTVVEDSEAIAALRLLLERTKVLPELAAACTLAAAEHLRKNFTSESHVVLILCGGNVGMEDLVHYFCNSQALSPACLIT